MVLRCARCGAQYAPDDVDFKLALARCRSCQTVMALGGRTIQVTPAAAPTMVPVVSRPATPLPEKFERKEVPGGLELSWRWFSVVHVFLVIFLVPWFGGLGLFFALSLASGAPLPFLLFPMIHVAAGVFLGWMALSGLLNRTTLRFDGVTLTVDHRPIPGRKKHRLQRQDVSQLYCRQHTHRGKNTVTHTWSLNAILANGRQLQLVKGLTSLDQALYLEHALEPLMGITDAPVADEAGGALRSA